MNKPIFMMRSMLVDSKTLVTYIREDLCYFCSCKKTHTVLIEEPGHIRVFSVCKECFTFLTTDYFIGSKALNWKMMTLDEIEVCKMMAE